jgi:hypothetical protein
MRTIRTVVSHIAHSTVFFSLVLAVMVFAPSHACD